MLEADPQDYSPPLTRWGHVWRTFLAVLISASAWGDLAGRQWASSQWLFWADLTGGVMAYALVFWRRRWPFRVALTLSILGLFSATAAGPAVLAVVSLATRRKVPDIIMVGAVAVVCGQVFSHYQPAGNSVISFGASNRSAVSSNPLWLDVTGATLATIAFAMFGMYLGSRRELIWNLRERARQAEDQQGLRVAQARSAERERIAREMHDALAHRISLVSVHAGALAYRSNLPSEQVQKTAGLIQAAAHEALTDLRQVLGVLRGDATGDRPQPTLRDLDTLFAEVRTGGMVLDVRDELDGREPAEQTGRTVYRVIQEGLTNARKHAPGTRVAVTLAGDPDRGVTVRIRNPRRVGSLGLSQPAASGLGLIGLQERAVLAGGTLEVEDTADAFGLRGWFPWTTT